MRRFVLVSISCLLLSIIGQLYAAPPASAGDGAGADPAARARALQLFSASPAAFIENTGQIDDSALPYSVRYAFYGDGANIFHTTKGPVFQVFQRERIATPGEASAPGHTSRVPLQRGASGTGARVGADGMSALFEHTGPWRDKNQVALHKNVPRAGPHVGAVREPPSDDFVTRSYSFSATFPKAKRIQPVGHDLNKAKVNYFIGNKPNKWRRNVPTYATVVYPGLYDGIDLYTYGRRTHLKYEFHVAPGADWRRIIIRYEGIDGLFVDARGALHVKTPLGELVDDAPYIYQVVNGRQVEVAGRYRLIDDASYTFEITGKVNPALELVIDPYLAWSSFLGGTSFDSAGGIAADADGNALIAGDTISSDFPAPGGFERPHNGSSDAFVAKVSASGQLLWVTFLGGIASDSALDIAAEGDGNALITGFTQSSDFPTPGGFDTTVDGGLDAFVAKVSASGQLLWASFLGGNQIDEGWGIACDGSGNALVTGLTQSPDFPTPGGFDSSFNWGTWDGGTWDGFVVKVSPSGQLLWGSFMGGSDWDCGNDIATDTDGNVLITGDTRSPDFPTPGGFETTYNGRKDAFVAKVSASGQLLWSSFLGGSDGDHGNGIATDTDGNALITGDTRSPDFPTPGGFDGSFNGSTGDGGTWDGFVVKVSPSGQLLWGSFMGGSGSDRGYGIATDTDGNALITGDNGSADFPTHGGFDTTSNGGGVFVAKVSPSGQLLWGSLMGGSGWDYGNGIATDTDGNALITGNTRSADFPTPGGFDTIYNGGYFDAFVAKIGPRPALTVESTPITGVEITGDRSGTTNYTAICNDQEVVNLTAPATTTAAGDIDCYFVRWVVDGVDQPDGQLNIQIIMQANHAAVAAYEIETHTLTVESTPITGATITGDRSGTTNYTATCDDQEVVNLTAPTSTAAGDLQYYFLRWIVDGVEQIDGQVGVHITMDADHIVVAVYDMPELSVESTPITGVAVMGDKPGTTNFTATCNYQQVVDLQAPLTVNAEGTQYGFAWWVVDGSQGPEGENTVHVTMDADHTAVAVYERAGTVFLEGPMERGQGALPPATSTDDPSGFGEFTVDIYAENMPGFAGFQLLAIFLDGLLQNTPGFWVSYSTPNPDFGGRTVVHNTLFLPEIDQACRDQTVGLFSMEREFIPPFTWGDYIDKSIPPEEDLAAVNPPEMVLPGHEGLTWLMSVNYWYTSEVAGGNHTISVDEYLTIFADTRTDPPMEIPYTVVTGSLTIGWPISGDVTGDCAVNILDVISVRNHLYQDVGSGDNWRYDLNGDGIINVLDMLIVRNNANATCDQQ